MKIYFIEPDKYIGKVGVIKVEGFLFPKSGLYFFQTKEIFIVKQKYWYLTLFMLIHEFLHWTIDCVFPLYPRSFPFMMGSETKSTHSEKYHPLQHVVDKCLYIPEIFGEGRDK